MDKGKCVAANLFTVSDVLERAQISPLEAADHGAEILVKVKWADMKPMLGSKGKYPCNLDQADWRESCTPSFDFIRLDDPDPHSFSHGYNFRESTADGDVGAAQRVLTKWIGIRVILMIEGQGGRFDGITTMQVCKTCAAQSGQEGGADERRREGGVRTLNPAPCTLNPEP